jgi:hypothetical protein
MLAANLVVLTVDIVSLVGYMVWVYLLSMLCLRYVFIMFWTFLLPCRGTC